MREMAARAESHAHVNVGSRSDELATYYLLVNVLFRPHPGHAARSLRSPA